MKKKFTHEQHLNQNDPEQYSRSWQHWQNYGSCPECESTKVSITGVNNMVGNNNNPYITTQKWWKYRCQQCKYTWFPIKEPIM